MREKIAQGSFRDALAAIRRHRDGGHYLVLMSASVDFYVPEFGRQLGFDHVISTEVRWDGDRLDGTLTSPNRRGMEKAHCLRELLDARTGHGKLRLWQQRLRSAPHAAGAGTASWSMAASPRGVRPPGTVLPA